MQVTSASRSASHDGVNVSSADLLLLCSLCALHVHCYSCALSFPPPQAIVASLGTILAERAWTYGALRFGKDPTRRLTMTVK